MWGRVVLAAVVVTLTILWLATICSLFLDEQTFLQKWQRGLWNSANGVFDIRSRVVPYVGCKHVSGAAHRNAKVQALVDFVAADLDAPQA